MKWMLDGGWRGIIKFWTESNLVPSLVLTAFGLLQYRKTPIFQTASDEELGERHWE